MKALRAFVPLLALALALALAYRPGLNGGFLFDDYANLPPLGAQGPIDNWPAFWRYITSGTADPTGRPLALLSFLIDAHDWPADPLPFKRTNIILHLLNGLLLFGLLKSLATITTRSCPSAVHSRATMAAVLAAGFWLLHPLFVSTTLYIVQREAMLPALFILLGLLLWLRGRTMFHQGRNLVGVLWTTAGLGGCTVLAVLGKANGVLLPALALTIELVYLRPMSPVRTANGPSPCLPYQRAMLILAGIPTTLVAAYLLYRGWHGLIHGISTTRPWTLAERLLTQPRILMDYLELLWLPRPFTPGLFNDHIRVSTGLWSPIGTLLSLVATIALVGIGVVLRKRQPVVATAIIFFFVGQSIESSTVPLELYFEHRNYLPALLMFWPLALWLCDVPQNPLLIAAPRPSNGMTPGTRRTLKATLAIVLLAGLTGMTHARATLWGNTHDQALVWAKLNPASPRAQANAAQAEMKAGHPVQAAARLNHALVNAPDEVQLAFNLLGAECQMGHIRESTLHAAQHALRTTRDPGSLLEHWFERALEQSLHPPCPEMNLTTIDDLLAASRSNGRLMSQAGRRQDIYHLQGNMALLQGDPDLALVDFDLALDQQVRATVALEQAARLGAAGFPDQALAHLNHYQLVREQENRQNSGMARIHAWVLHRQRYWDGELVRLRNTLIADQRAKGQPST